MDFFLKVIIGLIIGGIIIFDAGSIAVNFFSLDATADDIANAVSTGGGQSIDVTQREIETEAAILAEEAGAKLIGAELDEEGFVTITLRRSADTIVAGKIGWFDGVTRVTADSRVKSTN
jgi:hypothetical protein